MLYARNVGPRLAIGWTMGTLVSALGVYLSLKIDLPTGATIVCTFGIVLIAMALLRRFIPARTPAKPMAEVRQP
jgi:zinc/manganese transport system permease protein